MNTTTSTINDIISRRSKTLNQMATLVTSGQTSSPIYKQLEASAADDDEQIAQLRQLESIKSKLATIPAAPVGAAPVAAPKVEVIRNQPLTAEQRTKINRAWAGYLQSGRLPAGSLQTRDILVSGSGAAIVPEGFNTDFAKAVGFYGPVANLIKRQINDNPEGANVRFPTSDDSATTSYMSLIAESATTSSLEVDPTIAAPTVNELDALASQVLYSYEFDQDAFDLSIFLNETAAARAGKSLELAILKGIDINSNPLPHFPTGGLLASAPVGATAAVANGLGYQDFVDLFSSVPREFGLRGSWLVAESTWNYLLSLTTSDGRPLFSFDASTGIMSIFGRPVYVASNNAMPAYNSAAGSKCVLFGDFSKAFGIAQRSLELRVLNERYADSFLKAAQMIQRVGGVQLLPNAVKALAVA
jgi:HK97 family phage major capsid protein